MNMTQLRVILQYAVVYAAAYISAKGYMSQTDATALLTWIAAGVPVVYSIWKSRDQGKLEAAAHITDANGTPVQIVAPDAMANASSKTNIVPASENKVVSK